MWIFSSLPSRERGLKFKRQTEYCKLIQVAPFTGAWIEIRRPHHDRSGPMVAPFTGAWIEIVLLSAL